MELPIVRLVGRELIKVLYGDKKWSFEKGIDYTDVHPSFSAHLSTLKDNNGKPLFEVIHKVESVKAKIEQTVDAFTKDDSVKNLVKKRSIQLKTGTRKIKHRPAKLNTM